MKSHIVLFIIIFVCSCQNIDKKLIVNDEFINLSDVFVNEAVIQTIHVKNPNSKSITIDTIMASCSCVKVLKGIKEICPYCIDSIVFEFSSMESGYISRGISFKYNNMIQNIIIEGYINNKENK